LEIVKTYMDEAGLYTDDVGLVHGKQLYVSMQMVGVAFSISVYYYRDVQKPNYDEL